LSREGDVLVAECPGRTVRVYATAQTVYDPYVAAQTPYLAVPMTQVVGFCTGHARTVEEIAARIADARTRWLASVERFGDMAECYTAIQTCLAWDTIYEPQGDRVVSPVSRVWNVDRGRGGFVLFCWDTYFAAIMAGIDNKAIAYANAVEITREIRDLGFVPNNAQATGRKSCDRSQPPVGSITILDLYRQYGDRWLLEETFDDLLTWNCFWIQRRLDASSGLLCWGSHPFTPRAGDPLEVEQPNTWLGAILETGLDNSPLYDDVPFDPETHLMPLADVGLNGLYVADCRALAEMADALGRPEAEELRARADQFAARLQTLWDDASGIYLNRRTDTGESSHKLAPTNFYPMLGCVPTQAQAERMVREHLLNPDEFATPWPLPSIAKRDPAYPEQEYWRGRVWGPMNWLVYLGLCQYDLPEARAWLAARSEALFLKEWREHGHVHENYNAETGEGDDVTSSDRFYHWGGLLGLIALRERG
jgi:neutral trehalase